jgi:WD repeat-containing protein 42A
MDHDRTQDSSNEKSDDGMDIDLETPKDTWRPLFEVHKREQGYGNRIPMSYVFSNRCGASVHLVQRLQLYSKLDHHEGCVNALHFNKQGKKY